MKYDFRSVMLGTTIALIVAVIMVACAKADVQERVIDLPEDGDMWFTSLFLHDNWQQNRQETMVVNAFETDHRLIGLREQTIFNTYTQSDPHYQQTFSEAIPELPAITVQRPDGSVVYKASGPRIPRSGSAIADSIQKTSQRRCWRRGNCEPDNSVQPYREREQRGRLLPVNPLSNPIPDLIDMGNKAVQTKRFFDESMTILVYIVAALVVLFIGNKLKGE